MSTVQEAVSYVLEKLSSSSSTILYYGALLSAITIAGGADLPPGLATVIGGIGGNIFADLITSIKSGSKPSDEEIEVQIKRVIRAIEEGENAQLLTEDAFYRSISQLARRISIENEQLRRQLSDVLDRLAGQSVLSIYPKTYRPLVDVPLAGREEDLRWLHDHAERRQDSLLVGQPGSGKTFLFRQMIKTHQAFFVVGDERGQLKRAIESEQPTILMVDDAHLYEELLRNLLQLRFQIGMSFAIFANCWPSKRAQLQAQLGLSQHDTRELSLLHTKHIVAILKSMGVEEPFELVRELVNQADGRPGLAVSLADHYAKGAHTDLFSGDIVANHLIENYVKKDIDATLSERILAALSLGGDVGMSPRAVANAFDLNTFEVDRMISELSAGGIVLETSDDMKSVRPSVLRDVLIRRESFRTHFMHQASGTLIDVAPNKLETTFTLLNAKSRGATGVPDKILRSLLENLWEGSWRYWPDFYEALRGYSRLGRSEAQWVIDNFADDLTKVASGTLNSIPEETIPLLLDNADSDTRPLSNNHPDHPLGIIRDWATDLGNRRIIEARKLLVEAAIRWYVRAEQPTLCLEAIVIAFDPKLIKGHEDLSDENKYVIEDGYFTSHGIRLLQELWLQAMDFLRTIPVFDWRPLISLVDNWLYYMPRNISSGASEVTVQAAREFANALIKDVASLSPKHQGLMRALENRSRWQENPKRFDVDPEFDILYPVEPYKDFQEAELKHRSAAADLATKWSRTSPAVIVSKLEKFEGEAHEADLHYRHTVTVCTALAQRCADPIQWFDTFASADLPADLIDPFLRRLYEIDEEIWFTRLKSLLEDIETSWVSVSCVLNLPTFNQAAFDLIEPYLGQHTTTVTTACHADSTPSEVVSRLLNSRDPEVAKAAAKGLWYRYRKGIVSQSDWYRTWKTIAIKSIDEDWLLKECVSADPSFAYEWLIEQVEKNYPTYHRFGKSLSAAVNCLTRFQRFRLLEAIPAEGIHLQLVAAIVGDDIELFRHLMSPELGKGHFGLRILPSIMNDLWLDGAIVALDAGCTPKETASALVRPRDHTSGEQEIEWWQHAYEIFSAQADHADKRVREIVRLGKQLTKAELERLRTEGQTRSSNDSEE